MVLFTPAREAGIAQLVEQLICNQQVIGSNPIAGSGLKLAGLGRSLLIYFGGMVAQHGVEHGEVGNMKLSH